MKKRQPPTPSQIAEINENLARTLLADELIQMEPTLTIFELMLLLRAAANPQDAPDIAEPISTSIHLDAAIRLATSLHESTLLQLARQQRLMNLKLMEEQPDPRGGYQLQLTSRGHDAVNYWLGALYELGFRHPDLMQD